MVQTIEIERNSSDPVYQQIADQLRRFITSGVVSPGTALPPVRQLASDLGVNLNTVARAYRLLEVDGFLVIQERAGAVVVPPADEIDETVQERLLAQLHASLARLRQAGMAVDEMIQAVRDEAHAAPEFWGRESA